METTENESATHPLFCLDLMKIASLANVNSTRGIHALKRTRVGLWIEQKALDEKKTHRKKETMVRLSVIIPRATRLNLRPAITILSAYIWAVLFLRELSI